MPTSSQWLAFLVASILFIQVPGPSLLFTIGRALTVGRREALLSVVGNGIGVTAQVLLVAVGLGAVVAASATAYTVIKVAGAAYVIWLGIQAIRHRGEAREALEAQVSAKRGHALRIGFVVGVTNPKTILFFVAFLPQFTNTAAGHVGVQMAVLGAGLRRHGDLLRQHVGAARLPGPGVVRPQARPARQARRGRRRDDGRPRRHAARPRVARQFAGSPPNLRNGRRLCMTEG